MKNYESCSESESESYCESHHESKCKKPKRLVLIADDTAPDSLVSVTNLTSLTSGVIAKNEIQVSEVFRDNNNVIRGNFEFFRILSIYSNQPDKFYALVCYEFTLFTKRGIEKYSLVTNEDGLISQRQFSFGPFKLTSTQGKATYSKVAISTQAVGGLNQRSTFVFY